MEVQVDIVKVIKDAPDNALTSSITFSLVRTKYRGMSKFEIGTWMKVLARSLVFSWDLVCTVGAALVLTVEALNRCLWLIEVELKVTKKISP